MNKFLIVVLLLVCSSGTRHQNNYLNQIQNDWKKDKLKGRVKQVVEKELVDNGTVVSTVKKVFSAKGFLVIKTEHKKVFGKELNYEYIYSYDTSKAITRIQQTFNGKKGPDVLYYYDSHGNLVRDACSPRNTLYKYDENNRLIQKLDYMNQTLTYKTISEYLQNGDRKDTHIWEEKKEKMMETIENDSVTTYRFFDDGVLNYISISKRDASGNIIYKCEKKPDNTVVGYGHSYYNRYNDKVMDVYRAGETNRADTTRYSYKYDKTGNWTRFDKKKVREITYW
jgi:hypothetical protein